MQCVMRVCVCDLKKGYHNHKGKKQTNKQEGRSKTKRQQSNQVR